MTKRILFLMPQLPYPPQQGTTLRTFGLFNGLAQRGHEMALICFREADQPDPAETPLPDMASPLVTLPAPPARSRPRRLLDLAAGHTDMARRLWLPAFLEALRDLLSRERFDVIQIEGLEMAVYLPEIVQMVRGQSPGTLLVYDAANAEHALQQRMARQDWRTPRRWPMAAYSSIQARRLADFERQTVRLVDPVGACSKEDAALIAALGQPTPITVVPNAIDVDSYAASDSPPADVPHPALVFTGKMDYRPNIDAVLWFAEEILPRIREKVPGAHFLAVGQKPHPRLDVLRGREDVTLTGFVPEIQPYIGAADVFVTPLRMGSGTRLKLLEAMAMGRAIVSTRLGAEGLHVQDGEHLLLADEPDAFADAVVALLGDDARRRALGERGREFVLAHHDWAAVIPRLEGVCDDSPR